MGCKGSRVQISALRPLSIPETSGGPTSGHIPRKRVSGGAAIESSEQVASLGAGGFVSCRSSTCQAQDF